MICQMHIWHERSPYYVYDDTLEAKHLTDAS